MGLRLGQNVLLGPDRVLFKYISIAYHCCCLACSITHSAVQATAGRHTGSFTTRCRLVEEHLIAQPIFFRSTPDDLSLSLSLGTLTGHSTAVGKHCFSLESLKVSLFASPLQAVHGLTGPGAGVRGQPGHVQPHTTGPDGEVCSSQRPTGHRQEPDPVHAGSVAATATHTRAQESQRIKSHGRPTVIGAGISQSAEPVSPELEVTQTFGWDSLKARGAMKGIWFHVAPALRSTSPRPQAQLQRSLHSGQKAKRCE